MLKNYLRNWNYKRLIQLGFGLYFFWEYFQHPSIFSLIFGGIMGFQAIANVGCFSTRGCSTNFDKNKKYNENNDIEFEEIK